MKAIPFYIAGWLFFCTYKIPVPGSGYYPDMPFTK